jgi:hypothetical protein
MQAAPIAPQVVSSKQPVTFFVTGTGRCGTTLIARLLSLGKHAKCEHEQYFRHHSMVSSYLSDNDADFAADIAKAFEPARLQAAAQGHVLGVSSGHLYFAIPQLHKLYGDRCRFIALVRQPADFARSALARGFFDPSHPKFCDQIRPHPNDPIAASWDRATPLERNLWYWRLVNGFIVDTFDRLPPHLCRVVRMEDINASLARDLCRFVGIADVTDQQIDELLGRRINASPGGDKDDNTHGAVEVNPYSLPIAMPPVEQWSAEQLELLERYTGDLTRRLYGE